MATANHVLLQRTILTATTASITLDNIPQTGYTDLKLVYSARYDVSDADLLIQFNGSTASFSGKRLYGTGSGAASDSSGRVAGVVDASNWTANTFSNGEIYIPNYTSSNYKSFGSDSVSENNATQAYAYMIAGLWSNTASITSITLGTVGSQFVTGSSFSLYGIADVNTTPKSSPKAFGGDIIKSDGTYWYHAFLSSGTFTPQVNLTCDYLVIAGGGPGGSSNDGQHGGGGGGAGGYLSSVGGSGGGGSAGSALSLTSGTSYLATVGAGGTNNTNGSNSVFSTVTAIGGGAGAIGASNTGNSGGSGGGGASSSSPGAGGAGTSGQGYAGGAGQGTNNYVTGAGGGAGALGGNGPTSNGGTAAGYGGAGLNTLSTWATVTGTGVSGYYAGGGGSGSGQFANPPASNTSAGGGGKGAFKNGGSSYQATAGTANTGSGGGGSAETGTGYSLEYGGNGGSGIIIIRYPV